MAFLLRNCPALPKQRTLLLIYTEKSSCFRAPLQSILVHHFKQLLDKHCRITIISCVCYVTVDLLLAQRLLFHNL